LEVILGLEFVGLPKVPKVALFRSQVNVTLFNTLGPDVFINTMSYHDPADGGIEPWRKDMNWLDQHGFDRGRVNIGLAYYTNNYTSGAKTNEPTWGTLSDLCPDAPPEQHVCAGITFAGKAQNPPLAFSTPRNCSCPAYKIFIVVTPYMYRKYCLGPDNIPAVRIARVGAERGAGPAGARGGLARRVPLGGEL
jgi:hypothetical protein